jgi:cytoskeletal protein CcmA (bactofilin family)
VIGPVHAVEYLELQAKAKVSGDVYYRALEIQLGATVEGVLVHQDRVDQAKKTDEIALTNAADTPAISG